MGPLSNSARRRPKYVFHYGHSVARQVFAKTPQRMPRGLCVAAMRELAPLHCRRVHPRPCLPVASLRPPLVKAQRPSSLWLSLTSPSRSPELARGCQSAVAMGAATELAAVASSLPPSFPACATTLSVVCRSPCTNWPVTVAAVARRRRRRCLLSQPALLQPSPAEPRAGRGSGWPRLAWPHHRPAFPLASLAGRRPSPAGRTGSDGLLCCDSREGPRAAIRLKGGV